MKRAMMTSFGIIKYPMAPTLACPGYPHPMANEILKLIELIIKLLLWNSAYSLYTNKKEIKYGMNIETSLIDHN